MKECTRRPVTPEQATFQAKAAVARLATFAASVGVSEITEKEGSATTAVMCIALHLPHPRFLVAAACFQRLPVHREPGRRDLQPYFDAGRRRPRPFEESLRCQGIETVPGLVCRAREPPQLLPCDLHAVVERCITETLP